MFIRLEVRDFTPIDRVSGLVLTFFFKCLAKSSGSNSQAPLLTEDFPGAEPGEMDSFLHQPGFSSADPDPPARSVSLPSAEIDESTTDGVSQNQLSPPAHARRPNDAVAAANSQEGEAMSGSCLSCLRSFVLKST